MVTLMLADGAASALSLADPNQILHQWGPIGLLAFAVAVLARATSDFVGFLIAKKQTKAEVESIDPDRFAKAIGRAIAEAHAPFLTRLDQIATEHVELRLRMDRVEGEQERQRDRIERGAEQLARTQGALSGGDRK